MSRMFDENGNEWEVGYGDESMIKAMEDNSMSMEEYDTLPDYIPGLDDGEWIDTDDEWLDDFAGEEDFG